MVHVAKHLVAEENKESIEPATICFQNYREICLGSLISGLHSS